MKRNSTHIRSFPDVKIKLDNLARKVSLIEERNVKIPEVVRRLTNIPDIDVTLLKDAEIKRRNRINNRGQTKNIFLGIFVMALFFIFIVIGFYIYGLSAPIVGSVVNTATDELVTASSDDSAIFNATNSTFVKVNEGVQFNLEWVSYAIFIVLIFSFLIIAFFVRSYPWLVVVWLGIVIIMVYSSILMADSYQDLASSGGLVGEAYQNWQQQDFLFNYYPTIIGTLGLIGGVVLFIFALRGNSQEVNL